MAVKLFDARSDKQVTMVHLHKHHCQCGGSKGELLDSTFDAYMLRQPQPFHLRAYASRSTLIMPLGSPALALNSVQCLMLPLMVYGE